MMNEETRREARTLTFACQRTFASLDCGAGKWPSTFGWCTG